MKTTKNKEDYCYCGTLKLFCFIGRVKHKYCPKCEPDHESEHRKEIIRGGN